MLENSNYEKYKGQEFTIRSFDSSGVQNRHVYIRITIVGFVSNEPNILIGLLDPKYGIKGVSKRNSFDIFKIDIEGDHFYINVNRLERYPKKEKKVKKAVKDLGIIDDLFD